MCSSLNVHACVVWPHLQFHLTTLSNIYGYRLKKDLGVVSAAQVRSRNILFDVLSAFQGYARCHRNLSCPVFEAGNIHTK